jgi:hypothetical protein
MKEIKMDFQTYTNELMAERNMGYKLGRQSMVKEISKLTESIEDFWEYRDMEPIDGFYYSVLIALGYTAESLEKVRDQIIKDHK